MAWAHVQGERMKIYRLAAIPKMEEVRNYINPRYYNFFLQGPKSVHEELSSKNARILANLFPNMKFLNGGYEGIVYDIGINRVLKLTPESNEYEVSKFFLKAPESFYVRIFDIMVLENDNKLPIYGIIKEKVKPMSKEAISVAEWLWGGREKPKINEKTIEYWNRKWKMFNRIKRCNISNRIDIHRCYDNMGISSSGDIVVFDPS